MTEYRICADLSAAANLIADTLLQRLAELLKTKPELHLAVTGGTLGIALLSAAAEHPSLKNVDWSLVHIWWGDERFVAADSPDRNDGQAWRALFHLLPEARLHRMPAADQKVAVEQAAAEFARQVSDFTVGGALPFDITLLGMGPDGHVASLFPGKPESDRGELVMAELDSPKPPPQRISFTYEALIASSEVWFVVAGADKAEAAAIANSRNAANLPAGRVHGRNRTIWFLDEAAAASLGR